VVKVYLKNSKIIVAWNQIQKRRAWITE